MQLPAVVLTTAATTTATASAMSAAATTATAIFLRTCFVNVQSATVQFRSVECVDGAITFCIHAHFHKAKAARLASFAICYDADTVHGPVCFKQGPKGIFGRPEAEVSHKNIFQNSFFLNLQNELIGQIEQRR